MTKDELELKVKELEEELAKKDEIINTHVVEKQYLAQSVDTKDKEIANLKLQIEKYNDNGVSKKQLELDISTLKKQVELAREGERIRANQLQDLMKTTSNILNSLQPQIENSIELFNALVDKISNTFKPKGGE